VNCPGFSGCGEVRCGTGGNCYSDCSDCGPSPSPGASPPPGSPPPGSPPPWPCTEVGPSTPVLSSPIDGAIVPSLDVDLYWDEVISWGTACPGDGVVCGGASGDWSHSDCPDREYRVYLTSTPPDHIPDCTEDPGNTSCDVSVAVDITYFWHVCADNGIGAGGVACSDPWSFTAESTPPDAPDAGGLSGPCSTPASSCCNLDADFSWDNISDWGVNLEGNSNYFLLYLDGDLIYSVNCGDPPSCSVSDRRHTETLLGAGGYDWRICASNDDEDPAPDHVACTDGDPFSRANFAPDAPVLIQPADGLELSVTTVSLEWGAVSNWGCNLDGNDNRFLVFFDDDAAASIPLSFFSACDWPPGTTTCLQDSLILGTTYYWGVRASNDGNRNPPDSSDFYADSDVWSFAPLPGAWWQTTGGNVHSDGTVNSDIPLTCGLPDCNPYLMLGDQSVLSYNALGDDLDFAEIAVDSLYAQSTYEGRELGYNYWLYELINEEKWPYSGGSLPDPGDGGAEIYDTSSTGLINMYGPLEDDKKVVILHGGDINIIGEIDVSPGSFLMVVSSGTITINDDVNLVEGIFIAENIIFAGTGSDLELDAQGTFVGWNSVSMSRDIGGIESLTNPSVVFTYRPDFMINAPDFVKRAIYSWSQVPG